jgi:hypothetical protein
MTAEPLDAEDAKLVVLARSAMARAEAGGAAVRDVDGRGGVQRGSGAGGRRAGGRLRRRRRHRRGSRNISDGGGHHHRRRRQRPVMTAPTVKPLRKITGNLATVSRSAAEPK